MSELLDADEDNVDHNTNRINYSRPSLAQVKTVVAFMEKHPELANKKQQRLGHGQSKYKKFWVELANTVNELEGSMKTTKGWIKFWSDKKRFTVTKHKQIEEGRLKSSLTLLEKRIYDLCEAKSYVPRKKRAVKQEPGNGEDSLDLHDRDGVFVKGEDLSEVDCSRLAALEADEERQLSVLEKLVDVMDQQSAALTRMAQANLTNSKAFERIAEASHMQAMAVDRLVGSFETIGASTHDIRNAILGIDYTLKRCYPNSTRQNSTLFS